MDGRTDGRMDGFDFQAPSHASRGRLQVETCSVEVSLIRFI